VSVSPATRAGAPGIPWMIACSLWLVPVVFGFGMTSWIGFALIGLLVLRWRWVMVAGVLVVPALRVAQEPWSPAVSIMLGRFEFGELLANHLVLFIVYLGGVGYALHANRVWLRILWDRRERGVRMLGRGTVRSPGVPDAGAADVDLDSRGASAEPFDRSAPPPGEPPPGELNPVEPTPGELPPGEPTPVEPPPVATSIPLPLTPTPLPSISFALPLGPLDVHTASVEELAGIPAIGLERAQLLAAARESQRFTSLDEVAALLDLDAVALIRVRPYLKF